MLGYKTLWYDYDNDTLAPDEYCLEQRYRNKNTHVRKTAVVGEKEAYNVVAYFSMYVGCIPPTETEVAVKILKHIKSIEKPVDVV